MRKFLVLLFIFTPFFACKKDNNNNLPLFGIYNEVIPVNQNTQLDFLDSYHVVVSGSKIQTQPTLLLGTNLYHINGNQIAFFSDSVNIKDTTTLYFKQFGGDSLFLSTCPYGADCMIQTYAYIFAK
jgi:hypothetical protein